MDTGAKALDIDIDAAGLMILRKQSRPVSPKTPEKLREITCSRSSCFVQRHVDYEA